MDDRDGDGRAGSLGQGTARVDQPGRATLRARASDLAGRTQPETPVWNKHGYGNNAIQPMVVNVTPSA